tara:strand:+ start:1312 stop:1728 length:417 start_codon:yes stop_codon:yes gene_type:complete
MARSTLIWPEFVKLDRATLIPILGNFTTFTDISSEGSAATLFLQCFQMKVQLDANYGTLALQLEASTNSTRRSNVGGFHSVGNLFTQENDIDRGFNSLREIIWDQVKELNNAQKNKPTTHEPKQFKPAEAWVNVVSFR